MTNDRSQSGFSAVELLISLFIAVAFIASGYQLYSVVIKDGSDARQRARASNIAYEKLLFYSPQAINPCTAITPSPAPTIPANSLPAPSSLVVTVSCPYGTANPVSKVTVTVKYGTPQKEVSHVQLVSN